MIPKIVVNLQLDKKLRVQNQSMMTQIESNLIIWNLGIFIRLRRPKIMNLYQVQILIVEMGFL